MDWDGLFLATHPDVYEPSHDSWLLARAVAAAVRPGDRVADVGCGTGIVALAAGRAGAARVTATDRNVHAVRLAQHNARENRLKVDAVQTDLLAGLRGPFDLVAFNPPYLPTGPDDHVQGPLDWAFDGGLDGNEVVLRFAAQLKGLATAPREVLVVHSSLSDPRPLEEAMGYAGEVVEREEHFFERLTVRRFTRVHQT